MKAERAGGGKTKKQKEIEHKLEEGLRKQTAGAWMCDKSKMKMEAMVRIAGLAMKRVLGRVWMSYPRKMNRSRLRSR